MNNIKPTEAANASSYAYPGTYNGPQYDQDEANMIPPIMEPQILDIHHGLNMPDMPTENISGNAFDAINSVAPGSFADTGSAIPNDANVYVKKNPNESNT